MSLISVAPKVDLATHAKRNQLPNTSGCVTGDVEILKWESPGIPFCSGTSLRISARSGSRNKKIHRRAISSGGLQNAGISPSYSKKSRNVSTEKTTLAAHYAVDLTSGASGEAPDLDDDHWKANEWLHREHLPLVARLERSFLADSAVGRVECNSKGCRPIHDEEDEVSNSGCGMKSRSFGADDFLPLESRMVAFRQQSEKRENDSRAKPQFSFEFAMFLNEVWKASNSAEKFFMDALRRDPGNVNLLTTFAEFSWKVLRNKQQAEELYSRALHEDPENAEGLAGYALFLWQSESEE